MKFRSMRRKKIEKVLLAAVLGGMLLLPAARSADAGTATGTSGKWMSGDFHQHTFYTDGSNTFDFVMEKSNEYGLSWWANSEHGGSRNRDGNGNYWDNAAIYPVNPILGDYAASGGHQVMWRWQSLRDYVFPDILAARSAYSTKKIASGLEWNVPDHEHCSVGVVDSDASAISAFEFMFDESDRDTSRIGERTAYGLLSKQNSTNDNAIAACAWLQDQYEQGLIDGAWIVFAHIERQGTWATGGYDVENFRDFNNAGPDVCFGFEGAPGHQANSNRGGFDPSKAFGGTYGGVGYYTATVGGLWDALLGEGRKWFNFASSDYHRHHTDGGDDFYPGEYQKTWTYVVDADKDKDYSLKEIAAGLRSGNSFHVTGDLINALEFTAQYSSQKVSMGGDLVIKPSRTRPSKGTNTTVTLKIRFKSPTVNNNGDAPVVHHVDLIAGDIAGKISSGSADYSKDTNETTKIIATFTASNWKTDSEGYKVITYTIRNLTKNTYFRLRGTNLAPNTAYETDVAGNPLADSLATANLGLDEADEAWADLWFYSNPIFVYVKN